METGDAKLIADVIINLFAAGSLLIISRSLYRAAPTSAVYERVRFALWLGAALFGIRAVAWWTGSSFLSALEIGLAAVSPIAALILAEGLLRRHAPLATKLIVVSATCVALLVHIVPGLTPPVKLTTLLMSVAGSLVAIAVFMLTRIRDDLDEEESRTAGRVLGSLLLVTPCIATDFGNLFPGFPVRIGALSIVFLLYISFGAGSTSNKLSERIVSILVFLATAAVFAIAHAMVHPGFSIDALLRAAAVGFAGLISAALFSETMGARSERRRKTGDYLNATSFAGYIRSMFEDDRLTKVRRLDQSILAPLDHSAFSELLSRQPVLRLKDAPWSTAAIDPGVERAMSLLKTYDATHILRIADSPRELLVFSIPSAIATPRLESEIDAAQRIGELLCARECDR